MLHTKTSGTGNKIKFVLLWIVSYIGVSLCSLMPSAATSLVASVNSVNHNSLVMMMMMMMRRRRRMRRTMTTMMMMTKMKPPESGRDAGP